ncbi:MAG: CoA pyrophosphatase [Sphingomonadaceae bacterium]
MLDKLRFALAADDEIGNMLIAGDDAPAGEGPLVPAAVLVAIVARERPALILTERNAGLARHAGQIAFPGGRVDPGDADAEAAALREAQEEIGLDPGEVEILGAMRRYRTVTGFEVTPVIGLVAPGVRLSPSPAEVADIFEAPLDLLLDHESWAEREVEWRGATRRYYEMDHQGRRIWGATAAMIVNLGRLVKAAR